MSLLVTLGLLIVAIILLIVTFIFATDALFQLGVSNLFKTIEEVFDGKNKGETATDYLIYALIISGVLLGIFVLLIVIAIILVIVGGVALGAGAATGVDEGALAVAGAAEGSEAALAAGEAASTELGGEAAASEGSGFLSNFGNLLSSWVGTVLLFVLIVVIFTSSASGAFCFLAAAEIRKESGFNGDTKLKNAYEDAIIAGVSGIAVAVFSIMAIIGYYSYKYYRKRQLQEAREKIEAAKRRKIQAEARGVIRLENIRAGNLS